MPMPMMQVRHMRVRVRQRLMGVRVAVRAFGHRVMGMRVVAVAAFVVPMGVFVAQRFVGVRVGVGFNQMQQHPGQHERAGQQHERAA